MLKFASLLHRVARLRYLIYGPRRAALTRGGKYITSRVSWVALKAGCHVRTLGRVNRAVAHDYDPVGEICAHPIYFCANSAEEGAESLKRYVCRFQQELVFLDAKQDLGEERGQTYS